MAKIVVIAEEGERVLLDKLNDELGLDLRNLPVVYTGVGAINVIRALQGLDRDTELINVGYAGSANFDIGSWVSVTEVRLNHPNVTYPEPELNISTVQSPLSHVKQAPCFTSTDFVLASDYKDCVFDMELAFIAALGFRQVTSLKYVSDNLSLHSYHELTNGVE